MLAAALCSAFVLTLLCVSTDSLIPLERNDYWNEGNGETMKHNKKGIILNAGDIEKQLVIQIENHLTPQLKINIGSELLRSIVCGNYNITCEPEYTQLPKPTKPAKHLPKVSTTEETETKIVKKSNKIVEESSKATTTTPKVEIIKRTTLITSSTHDSINSDENDTNTEIITGDFLEMTIPYDTDKTTEPKKTIENSKATTPIVLTISRPIDKDGTRKELEKSQKRGIYQSTEKIIEVFSRKTIPDDIDETTKQRKALPNTETKPTTPVVYDIDSDENDTYTEIITGGFSDMTIPYDTDETTEPKKTIENSKAITPIVLTISRPIDKDGTRKELEKSQKRGIYQSTEKIIEVFSRKTIPDDIDETTKPRKALPNTETKPTTPVVYDIDSVENDTYTEIITGDFSDMTIPYDTDETAEPKKTIVNSKMTTPNVLTISLLTDKDGTRKELEKSQKRGIYQATERITEVFSRKTIPDDIDETTKPRKALPNTETKPTTPVVYGIDSVENDTYPEIITGDFSDMTIPYDTDETTEPKKLTTPIVLTISLPTDKDGTRKELEKSQKRGIYQSTEKIIEVFSRKTIPDDIDETTKPRKVFPNTETKPTTPVVYDIDSVENDTYTEIITGDYSDMIIPYDTDETTEPRKTLQNSKATTPLVLMKSIPIARDISRKELEKSLKRGNFHSKTKITELFSKKTLTDKFDKAPYVVVGSKPTTRKNLPILTTYVWSGLDELPIQNDKENTE